VASHLSDAKKTGSAQSRYLPQARIAALQARADEALTLVARAAAATREQIQGNMAALTGGKGLVAKAKPRQPTTG